MKIRILGWSYRNIRRMRDLTVDLTDENGKNYKNSLIMMPNGTGKTTTLHLIRAIFSGKAKEWKASEVEAYRPAFPAEEGQFSLKITVDEAMYYYILHLDYEEGKAWYETSRARIEGGCEEDRDLPSPLRGILKNEEFVNRFVFDGEQAKKMLNSKATDAENAIIYLYQLYKLKNLIDNIDGLIQTRQESGKIGSSSRSVKVYKGKELNKRKAYEELQSTVQGLKTRIEIDKKKYERLAKKYENTLAQDHRLKEEQEKFRQGREKNQEELVREVNTMMNIIRKPYNIQVDFHVRLKGLADNMQVLKLPKNTAQEFFKELAQGQECLCGRALGETERKCILMRAREYLGESSLVAVNSIKRALKEYEREDHIAVLVDRLKQIMKNEMKITQGMSLLAVQLAEEGNEEILKIQSGMEELKKEIAFNEEKLLKMTTKDYNSISGLDARNNLHKAKEAWDEAKENYWKANGTYLFTVRAERMKEYVGRIRDNALKRLKKYVIEETNRKTEKLIRNDTILIQNIAGHLILDGKKGASEGQTLAIAYAYIGTLFEHSKDEFPFVVDSPAAPADLDVRRKVANILPNLFEQLIVLVTSSEKNNFADKFYDRDDVLYLTVKVEEDKTVRLISGREFFDRYQEEEEE